MLGLRAAAVDVNGCRKRFIYRVLHQLRLKRNNNYDIVYRLIIILFNTIWFFKIQIKIIRHLIIIIIFRAIRLYECSVLHYCHAHPDACRLCAPRALDRYRTIYEKTGDVHTHSTRSPVYVPRFGLGTLDSVDSVYNMIPVTIPHLNF